MRVFYWSLFFLFLIICITVLFRDSKEEESSKKNYREEMEEWQDLLRENGENTQIIKTLQKRGERKCRACIEHLYQKPFKSVRPAFLKNPKTGKNLEIDCYNDELKLGLEYNGRQHNEFIKHFHGTREKFREQVERDRYKIKRLKEEGIDLIVIPYWIPLEDIHTYITDALIKLGRIQT